MIDGAARDLAPLGLWPNSGAVVSADDEERVYRLLSVLTSEISRRQHATDSSRHPAVLLVDRYESLRDDATSYRDDHGIVASLTRILRDGPGVDFHTVIATDPSTLGTRLVDSISSRVVLDLGLGANYLGAGVPHEMVPEGRRPPGRGFWSLTGADVQVAVDEKIPASGGGSALETLAAQELALRQAPLYVPPWLDQYPLASLPSRAGMTTIGVGGPQLAPVHLDLPSTRPGLLVVGPRRSGRSTTLVTLATQMLEQGAGEPSVVLIAPRGGPLVALAGHPGVLANYDTADAVSALPAILDQGGRAVTVVVDDAEEFTGPAADKLNQIVQGSAGTGKCVFVIGVSPPDYQLGTQVWFATLRRAKNVLVLRPPGRGDALWATLTLAAPSGGPQPAPVPGRGVLYLDGEATQLHVAVT